MIHVEPVHLPEGTAIGVKVDLPGTRPLTISTSKGYISAAHMDLPLLEKRHPERRIVAARVMNVREISDLLEAKVFDCTPAAAELGIAPGMTGREALSKMF
jgi:uncharacterized protein YunC (DUF1805 family)